MRLRSALGQSLPARARSNSGHVRYASNARKLATCDMPLRVDDDAQHVISCKVPIAARCTLALWYF